MTEQLGWTGRDGIVWRSPDSNVVVSSETTYDDPPYRIIVNNEREGKNQIVLRTNDNNWQEIVIDAIKFAEGYTKGKY